MGESANIPPDRSWRVFACLMSLVILAAVAGQTALRPGIFMGDTINSRLATVYALVHDHTWRIDRPPELPPNPFEPGTVDKVVVNGRLLSSKPPLIPLLMAGEYAALRAVFGWDLDNPAHLKPLAAVLIFTFCQLPFAVGLAFFAATARMFLPSWRRALPPLALLAFATPLWGYSGQFNNHTPAAAALMVCLYFALGMLTGRHAPKGWRFLLFGVSGGLVFAWDMPASAFVAAAGLCLLRRFPLPAFLWGGLGFFIPLSVHFGAMMWATGDPRPVQMREDLYVFESSYWRHPLGIDALNEPRGVYLFHMTLGRFGLFSLFPVLLLGVAGLFRPRCPDEPRAGMLAGAAAAAFLLLTAYYAAGTNNYGGASYGFRWYICAVPVLMLAALPVFARLRGRAAWALVLLLAAVSLYSSWECLQAPWGDSHEWTCRLIFGPAV
ncbi:MAG: hypothetical protein H3C30_08740 [Candidatus Hydrogenedentes bacterium]|nr:hypothetical protein [Candidatus Hydrogenedentota bacterium]